MKDTILLFESRDLCYESNRYFTGCLEDAFERMGYRTQVCDLSVHMEEQLEELLLRQETYVAAIDFNSLLPRLELEDHTPYLQAFCVPFFNYLVDHPLYHHAALKRSFPAYSVICIDRCHQEYVQTCYPHIKQAVCLPLGAMQAVTERSFGQKRLELLFLGTYEPERALYEELDEYLPAQKKEIVSLIERMEADAELTQEAALAEYLNEKNEILDREAFVRRLNRDYLADKYLRNLRRKQAVLAACRAEVPFTLYGHGWELVKELSGQRICVCPGVGFAASLQVMADAKMLLNSTPGFHGGLHDRVYSAMINRTVCFTEKSGFAERVLADKTEAVLYDPCRMDTLPEQIVSLYENQTVLEAIADRAYQKAHREHTWQRRAEKLVKYF